jgi:predicted RNA-binding protein YlxR (DUF448 family)
MKRIMSIKKHIPQRTCVACGQVTDKRKLIRLVRMAGNRVEVDTSGKQYGRGAYLCPAPECWETGLKRNRLEHALRTTLTLDNREQLMRYGQNLGQGAN